MQSRSIQSSNSTLIHFFHQVYSIQSSLDDLTDTYTGAHKNGKERIGYITYSQVKVEMTTRTYGHKFLSYKSSLRGKLDLLIFTKCKGKV